MIFGNSGQAGPWGKWVRFAVFFMIFWCVFAGTRAASGSEIFPEYEIIRPNVAFWVNIFTQYSESQGIIHDSVHPDIIYEVIDLIPGHTGKAKQINQARIKQSVRTYRNILRALSGKANPQTVEEKRVAGLFGGQDQKSDFRQAMDNIRCQKGLKEQFRQGLVRAIPYLDEFKRILRIHGVPEDLVYLPCVESSYNFKAYSRFGAAGIWQFTRSTGQRYMTIDYVVDERRDPFKSTRAAARLLKRNFDMTQNWPMAITAYNHGINGILRARNTHGTYERIFSDYRSRTFKFASRNFYSEFLAARKAAKNASAYFGPLTGTDLPKAKRWVVPGFVDPADLASGLKVRVDTIRDLNPALRQPVFSGQKYIPKGYELWLPVRISDAALDLLPESIFKPVQKPSRFHRVEKGETAGKIAEIHKVKLNDLILANNLNHRATIYIGQNLRIPVADRPQTGKQRPAGADVTKTADAETREPPAADARDKPAAIASEAARAVPPDQATIQPDVVLGHLKVEAVWEEAGRKLGRIRVEADETLGHIAMWARVPTQFIRRLNRLTYGRSVGMDSELTVPLTAVTAVEFEEQRFEYHLGLEEDFFSSFMVTETAVYRVEPGDSLWALCMKTFDIPVWLLRKYNPGLQAARIRPGQKIIYPVVSEGPDAALPGQ